jgi:hypothetical protein
MAALADDGRDPRNGETNDETHDGDIVGCSPAHTQRNKVNAVVHGRISLKRVSSRAAPDRALLWLGTKQRYLVDRSFSELTCGEDRISAVRDRVIDHHEG